MSFWSWFKTDGDKVFSFLSLSSLALQGVAGISAHDAQIALIVGVLATAAHQSFFPSNPSPQEISK